jgi:transcription elongation factor Elf1
MATGPDYTFACPECNECISVNGSMRDALVENGCVVCGTSVTPTVFCSSATGG